MHKKLFLASMGAIAFTGSAALAADLLPPPPLPPIFTWTGPYVGGQVGYAWDTGNLDATLFDPVTGTSFNASAGGTPDGVIGGAHFGYLYQINQWVLGIEGSVDGTSLSNTAVAAFPNVLGGRILRANSSVDVEGTIRGKIGIAAWDRVLIYGTGGVAFGGFSTDFTGATTKGVPVVFTGANASSTRTGWTAGGGLQYAATDNWWVFVEYRYTNFGSIRNNGSLALPEGAFFNESRQIRQNQVQAGFSYRFNLAPPVPVVARY